jgi:hypothetical protein
MTLSENISDIMLESISMESSSMELKLNDKSSSGKLVSGYETKLTCVDQAQFLVKVSIELLPHECHSRLGVLLQSQTTESEQKLEFVFVLRQIKSKRTLNVCTRRTCLDLSSPESHKGNQTPFEVAP